MKSSGTSIDVIEYVSHAQLQLNGHLYRARSLDRTPAPILIAVHGGGWKTGSAKEFQYLGPWLAERGIALFSIEYRLVKGEANRYPASAHDVRAAVQFIRANAAELGIDPARIGLLGASAGAHLISLVALAGENQRFLRGFPKHSHSDTSASVKCAVGIYGPYDLLAQWSHDHTARPHDNVTEAFMGTSAVDDRISYFEASPIAYATRSPYQPSFLISWGTDDDVVDWTLQSRPFVTTLKQAGFYVRTIPIHGAPHYWIGAPIDEHGSFSGLFAPQLLRFLRERL